MKVSSLKDLQKLLALCRKSGVESMKIDGIEFKLGDLPVQEQIASISSTSTQKTYTPGGVDESTKIDVPDALTEEQLLMWSVAPGGAFSGPGDQ